MDWQTTMNLALDYIEENLTDEIKLETAARFMGCSVWEFQRLFLSSRIPHWESIFAVENSRSRQTIFKQVMKKS